MVQLLLLHDSTAFLLYVLWYSFFYCMLIQCSLHVGTVLSFICFTSFISCCTALFISQWYSFFYCTLLPLFDCNLLTHIYFTLVKRLVHTGTVTLRACWNVSFITRWYSFAFGQRVHFTFLHVIQHIHSTYDILHCATAASVKLNSCCCNHVEERTNLQ